AGRRRGRGAGRDHGGAHGAGAPAAARAGAPGGVTSAFVPGQFRRRRRIAWRRWSLWVALGVLVVGLLATLIYLAARYEASQAQSNVERDAADALSDIRSALTRNVQTLQALQSGQFSAGQWQLEA